MKSYDYNPKSIEEHLQKFYDQGYKRSKLLGNAELHDKVKHIGIFAFKSYLYAVRNSKKHKSIDFALALFEGDKKLSNELLALTGEIEMKLRSLIIECAYEHTNNPFFYLLKSYYPTETQKITQNIKRTLHKWKKSQPTTGAYQHYRDYYLEKYGFTENHNKYFLFKKPITLEAEINYPPFHYFIHETDLGTLIDIYANLSCFPAMIQTMTKKVPTFANLLKNTFSLQQPKLLIDHLYRLKEIRNRCAHQERIFNRGYRAIKHNYRDDNDFDKNQRKNISRNSLLDIFLTLKILQTGIHDPKQNKIDFLNLINKCTDNESVRNFIRNGN